MSGLKKLQAWLKEEATLGLSASEKKALKTGVCDIEISKHMADTLSQFWQGDETTFFDKPEDFVVKKI